MKRLKIILAMAIFSILIIIIVKKSQASKEYQRVIYDAFDTYTVISIYSKNKDEAEQKLNILEEKFKEMHKSFSGFDEYENINNLKTLNDQAGKAPVKVNEDLFKLILKSLELEEKFKLGKLNIAIGPVTNIWREYTEFYNLGLSGEEVKQKTGSELPDRSKLEKLRPLIDKNNVIINKDEQTVFLKKEGMSLDLGAVAKGYAVEELANYAIKDLEIDSIIISSGGNVKCLNKEGIKKKYKIAIYNPESDEKSKDDQYLKVLNLENKSVVTTGDYQRYFSYRGKRYPHIVDPDSLYSSDKYRSFSVIYENSFVADYLSTSLFLSDPDKASKIEEAYGIGYVYLDSKDNLYSSENLKDITGD